MRALVSERTRECYVSAFLKMFANPVREGIRKPIGNRTLPALYGTCNDSGNARSCITYLNVCRPGDIKCCESLLFALYL